MGGAVRSPLHCLNTSVTFFAAKRASEQDKQALVDKVDAFIFDCDGRFY